MEKVINMIFSFNSNLTSSCKLKGSLKKFKFILFFKKWHFGKLLALYQTLMRSWPAPNWCGTANKYQPHTSVNAIYFASMLMSPSIFSCSLTHKRLPQHVAPCVSFGRRMLFVTQLQRDLCLLPRADRWSFTCCGNELNAALRRDADVSQQG